MEVTATTPLQIPTTMAPAPAVREAADSACRDGGCGRAERRDGHGSGRGRSHVQQGLRHLIRDIGRQVRDELTELRESGVEGSDEKIAAVREAFHDFRDQVRTAFHDAGRGHDFRGGAVPEGLAEAMAAFTAALRAINGPVEDAAPVSDPVTDAPATPAPAPEGTKVPAVEVAGPTGNLLDVSA